jgi:hypothetical protein
VNVVDCPGRPCPRHGQRSFALPRAHLSFSFVIWLWTDTISTHLNVQQ